jgi:hypothetical protein
MKVGQTVALLLPARAGANTMGWLVRPGIAGSELAASFGQRKRAVASYETTNLVLSKEASFKPPFLWTTLYSDDHYSLLPRRSEPKYVYERPNRATCIIAYWAAYIGVFELSTSTCMQGETAYSPHRNPARLQHHSASNTRHFPAFAKITILGL